MDKKMNHKIPGISTLGYLANLCSYTDIMGFLIILTQQMYSEFIPCTRHSFVSGEETVNRTDKIPGFTELTLTSIKDLPKAVKSAVENYTRNFCNRALTNAMTAEISYRGH